MAKTDDGWSAALSNRKPVTFKSLAEIFQGAVFPLFTAQKKSIKALEQRIADLEAREYQGVWDAKTAYAKGAMVSRQGSLWCSMVNQNHAKPGEHPHWKLVVKRGRGGEESA